jgi:hypothetical protein
MDSQRASIMDPLEGSSRWHRWAVTGTGRAISDLLDVLDANLPTDWKRLTESERLPFELPIPRGSAWYALDTTPTHSGVTLSLKRLRESELRGGGVWFAGPRDPTATSGTPSAWEQVMRFLDEGVVPAAQAVGADYRMPSPHEIFLSELPSDVRDRLRTFAQAARKSLPLNRQESDLWHGWVIAAYRTQAVVDDRQLTDWLIADGWSSEAAAELNLRFFDQCLLLSRYADEVSAA